MASMSTICNSPSKRLKFQSWTSSGEEIASNLDFLTEILLSLPATSLVRFKCVCKKWRYLILGTGFLPMHIKRNPKPSISGLYYLCETYPIPLQGHSLPTFTCFDTPGKNPDYKVHDSRHGLILSSIYNTYTSEPHQIMVCNPTTQKYKVFHDRELDMQGEGHKYNSRFYLYVNPSISPVYKLIIVRDKIKRSGYKIFICASNRSYWKTISLEAQPTWGRCLIHGFLSSDGIIYMITEKWYLLQFDVEAEEFSAAHVTQDTNMPDSGMIGYFGERANGNLILIVSSKSGPDFMVYEMDRRLAGQHWDLKHHIDPIKELNKFPEMCRSLTRSNFAVIWVGEDDDRNITLVLSVSKKAISYNHNSKEIKVICDLPVCEHLHFETTYWETAYLNVTPFIGSFCAV